MLCFAGRHLRLRSFVNSVGGQQSIAHTAEEILHAARVRRHVQHVGVGAVGYVHHGVEVLGDQHEGLGVLLHAGSTQQLILLGNTFDDFLTLVSHTATLQLLSLGRTLGLLDHADLLGLRLSNGRLALTLRRVNGVHGLAHASIWANIGDQGIDEVPAVGGHVIAQGHRHVAGDGVLGREGIIQVHVCHGGTDVVLHVGHDLLLVVGQGIEGLALAALDYLVLHGNGDLDEDVVLGLGFHHDIELTDLQADLGAHAVDVGQLEVQACVSHGHELTHPLNDGGFLRPDDEETVEGGGNNK